MGPDASCHYKNKILFIIKSIIYRFERAKSLYTRFSRFKKRAPERSNQTNGISRYLDSRGQIIQRRLAKYQFKLIMIDPLTRAKRHIYATNSKTNYSVLFVLFVSFLFYLTSPFRCFFFFLSGKYFDPICSSRSILRCRGTVFWKADFSLPGGARSTLYLRSVPVGATSPSLTILLRLTIE